MKLRTTSAGQHDGPTLLSDIGEAGMLQSIQARLDRAGAGGAMLGSGDDAAVWRLPPDRDLVVSQDALVEGKDWIEGWLTPAELGARALAIAVSDIAAMGAAPLYCLVTVCVSSDTPTSFMEGLLDGLTDAAGRLECPLSGGDLSAIDGPVVIDVSVAGTCPSGTAMRRDAGKKDDLLIVTGALGNAAAGLRHLQDPAHPHRARWHDSWTRPAPRIKEGVLLRERGVVCAGDISDGLLADCARTARASGCGAEIWIDQLPVDPEIQTAFPDWLAIATGSGEDFELLAAVAPDKIDAVMRNWPDDLAPLRIVGRLTGGSDVSILPTKGGDPVTLPAIISGHFDG